MTRPLAAALLLLTSFFWGATFTVVKGAVARVDVFVFLAQRFIAAAAVLAAIAAVRGGRPDRGTLRGGVAMGGALFLAFAFQTMALRHTSASNTAFLSGLSVVLVPVLGAALLRERVAAPLLAAVALAVAGLFLLTTRGTWAFGAGDALAAASAACIAAHVLLTGRYAAGCDIWWLTAVQIAVIAAGSTAVALATGERPFVWHPDLLGPLAFCALFATVFAFLVQTAVQRCLSPTDTAVVFCMEPVFAAVWAAWALGERLGTLGYAGAALIFAAMLIAELSPRRASGRNLVRAC